jgi:hypothetical protein
MELFTSSTGVWTRGAALAPRGEPALHWVPTVFCAWSALQRRQRGYFRRLRAAERGRCFVRSAPSRRLFRWNYLVSCVSVSAASALVVRFGQTDSRPKRVYPPPSWRRERAECGKVGRRPGRMRGVFERRRRRNTLIQPLIAIGNSGRQRKYGYTQGAEWRSLHHRDGCNGEPSSASKPVRGGGVNAHRARVPA